MKLSVTNARELAQRDPAEFQRQYAKTYGVPRYKIQRAICGFAEHEPGFRNAVAGIGAPYARILVSDGAAFAKEYGVTPTADKSVRVNNRSVSFKTEPQFDAWKGGKRPTNKPDLDESEDRDPDYDYNRLSRKEREGFDDMADEADAEELFSRGLDPEVSEDELEGEKPYQNPEGAYDEPAPTRRTLHKAARGNRYDWKTDPLEEKRKQVIYKLNNFIRDMISDINNPKTIAFYQFYEPGQKPEDIHTQINDFKIKGNTLYFYYSPNYDKPDPYPYDHDPEKGLFHDLNLKISPKRAEIPGRKFAEFNERYDLNKRDADIIALRKAVIKLILADPDYKNEFLKAQKNGWLGEGWEDPDSPIAPLPPAPRYEDTAPLPPAPVTNKIPFSLKQIENAFNTPAKGYNARRVSYSMIDVVQKSRWPVAKDIIEKWRDKKEPYIYMTDKQSAAVAKTLYFTIKDGKADLEDISAIAKFIRQQGGKVDFDPDDYGPDKDSDPVSGVKSALLADYGSEIGRESDKKTLTVTFEIKGKRYFIPDAIIRHRGFQYEITDNRTGQKYYPRYGYTLYGNFAKRVTVNTVEQLKKRAKNAAKLFTQKIGPDNFHLSTYANFEQVNNPPNTEPDFKSNSGSEYWYTKDGVYRRSDHWGAKIASCSWFLEGEDFNLKNPVVGFCKWKDFSPNIKRR